MMKDILAQTLTVASYEVRKYVRGRRLIGMLILLALIIALILGVPPALGVKYASQPNVFVSTFAGLASLLVVLGGVLFAADALVSEHEKRTGYFLFPNPVRREVLDVGDRPLLRICARIPDRGRRGCVPHFRDLQEHGGSDRPHVLPLHADLQYRRRPP